jgi:single-strand DNA-binding protein
VSFWERSAKSLKEHARKGSELFVEGWLKLDSWEDRNTGKQQQKLCIVGERWQFVGSRPRGQMASEQKQAKDNAQPAAFHQPVATSTNTEDQIPF